MAARVSPASLYKGVDAMEEKRKILDEAIRTAEERYEEYAKDRSMEYTYGYFDAVGVLRDLRRCAFESF